MTPLDVREWLEHERATGLSHADFAGEALDALDNYPQLVELREIVSGEPRHPSGQYDDPACQRAAELVEFRAAVVALLEQGGLVDGEPTNDQITGMLAMFLP